jgi:hypothetical protein
MPRAKPRFERSPLFGHSPATLTDAERATLDAICTAPEFAEHVAALAGEYRAKIAHDSRIPSARELSTTLREIERRATILRGDLHTLIASLGNLDERTRAALPHVDHDLLAGASVSLARLASEAAEARKVRAGKPSRGQVTLERAGLAVRALFGHHGLRWAVTVKRDVAADSPPVAVFRMITGNTGSPSHYLPPN